MQVVLFNSTDGSLSTGSIYDERYTFGATWGAGDVVGCGYTPLYDNGLIFFTLNGRWIGDCPFQTEDRFMNYKKMWLAAFSSNCEARIYTNYGDEPFLFKINEDNTIPYLQDRYREPIEGELEFKIDNNRLVHSPRVEGLTIRFASGSYDPLSAQSNLPIHKLPLHNNYYYYEIKVLSQPAGASPFLSYGLAMRPYPQRHHVGWNRNSIGLHRYFELISDDGYLFSNSYHSTKQISKGFGNGAIIGCGFNPHTKEVVFTENGTLIHTCMFDSDAPLYPTIAATSYWGIQVLVDTFAWP